MQQNSAVPLFLDRPKNSGGSELSDTPTAQPDPSSA